MMRNNRNLVSIFFFVGVVALSACTERQSYQEEVPLETINISPRIQGQFNRSKVVCFGRYAIEVPLKANLLWGGVSLPSAITVTKDGPHVLEQQVAYDIKKIQLAERTAEILYTGIGPVPESWLVRYFEHGYAKGDDFYLAKAYFRHAGYVFTFSYAHRDGEILGDFTSRISRQLNSLRIRDGEKIPVEAGHCIEHAFIATPTYENQEMTSAGIHIPDFPDVTFSVSSNKNAYSAYSSAEFESRVRNELSLLARIKAAQEQQGIRYPKRTILREGKRTVQHWKGEESLIRRADGTHDFEWAFVGTPGDVANPSEFNVQMYTKVAHNTVGAADKASLTDEEAIALWDKLLSGLKFRVKVPGAPEGSYYFLPGAATDGGSKP